MAEPSVIGLMNLSTLDENAPDPPWVGTEYEIGLSRYDIPRTLDDLSVELVQRPLSMSKEKAGVF